jgi:hypothetical protein
MFSAMCSDFYIQIYVFIENVGLFTILVFIRLKQHSSWWTNQPEILLEKYEECFTT